MPKYTRESNFFKLLVGICLFGCDFQQGFWRIDPITEIPMGFPLYGICFCLFLLFKLCICGSQHIGGLSPGFEATQTEWANNNGLFLLSNSSVFGFGFYTALDVHFFLLVVIHISSAKVVWTANRGKLINGSDKIMFKKNGNVQLQRGNDLAWSTNTSGQNAKAMELRDSGNLVLLGDNGDILWQSFSHPTDTLLPGQEFSGRMNLKSFPKNNLNVYLELKFGDLILYAGYETPQTYWSLASDTRKTNNSVTREVHSATIVSSAWNFYDQNKTLLWQFIFSGSTDEYATWAAILGSDGTIMFSNLQKGNNVPPEAFKIPEDSCSVPQPCDAYNVCYFNNWCQCPSTLSSQFNCQPPVAAAACSGSENAVELYYVGERLDYFALGFVKPFSDYNLDSCKEACLNNCSCTVLFFDDSTGHCFLFDQIGNF